MVSTIDDMLINSSTILHNVLIIMIIMLVFLSCTLLIYKRPNNHTQLSLPPGPISWPIVGCFHNLLTNKPAFQWMLRLMKEKNTEIACFRLGAMNVIAITSPEIACEVLKKQEAVFASRPSCTSAALISDNYLTTALSPTGDQWKKMKRVLTSHVLSPNTLNWLSNKRAKEADHLVRYIYNQCRNATGCGLINVRMLGQHFCGNIIRQMVFSKRNFGVGTRDGGPGVEEEEHIDSTFVLLNYLYSFGVSDYFPWLRMFDLDGHRKIIKNAIKVVSKYHDLEVDARIKMWKDGTKTKHEDILDVLINLKDQDGKPLLKYEEIKAQAIELVMAIVDNPSSVVEWVLAELLNEPKNLKRVTKELDNIVGKERLVQESDLPHLYYLNACLREAFRLHPLSAFVPQHLCASDTIVSNYFIPKDSHVVISRHGLGRNPRVWEEPLKFKPERHLKNDGSEVSLVDPELRILSFSAGRRKCPGIQLGYLVTSIMLARLLQGFDWAVNGGMLDLTESKDNLLLAKPLNALAKPRLSEYLYT